ncbi:cell division protein PerM [Actinomadura algeriensis]|uniref:Integral membrane protein n=1 Tax=Actinomadura algeriensis TaxID=1679523 RepID=A0ABR9JSR7_9ACTN|nr:DUF6350 family protein [Actinomadura algeriensis]MBE1533619.1 hypothetical protein [Actinomadura algeriensis]
MSDARTREAAPARRDGERRHAGGGTGRPLPVSGLVAALWCIGIGLAVLTTITLVGWIAAPRTAFGDGLPGVFRAAVNFWLISHHAGFSSGHGRVGLLPLGVLIVPGALLYRGGAWMIRGIGLPDRPRVAVARVAVSLAAPYAALAGTLALAATGPTMRPSAWQALVACFTVAVVAGGLGAARAVVAAQVAAEARGRRVRSGLGALLRLLPERARSLVIGVAGSTAVLLASGALLVAVSLALHLDDAEHLYDMLGPGIVGGVLLLLVELAFLPNMVVWGMSYAIGPGFSVGAGTTVSPTGVYLDVVPAFPPLAALPEPGPAPAASLLALAAPFLAGAVGGALTVRSTPSAANEAAPLWGFVTGALTGVVAALLAALSGGPLGGERMATVGPSPWQVGLMATLEVGISAAIVAWWANWRLTGRADTADVPRRRPRRTAKPPKPPKAPKAAAAAPAAEAARSPHAAAPTVPDAPPEPAPAPARSPYAPGPLEFEEAEPVLTPRRRPRRASEPDPEPEPPADEPVRGAEPGTVVVEGHIADEGPDEPVPPPRAQAAPEPGPEPAPEPQGPERTENRGGAIYVLRNEQRPE